MTNIAAKLEADSRARAKTIDVVLRLMTVGATLSVVGLAFLLQRLF